MRRATLAALLIAALAALAPAARAQTPTQTPAELLLARGVQAARDLDYDSAATLLRASLAHPTAARLADADRLNALVYLGAIEVYRTHRDSAASAFRRVLALNPRYRIDQVVFPPEVTGLFDEVRRTTRIVLVVVPPRSEFAAGLDRLSVHLVAAAPHRATAVIAREGGARVRTLLDGIIRDSMDLPWDANDSLGTAVANGRYVLRVMSRDDDGQTVRTVVVPLDIRTERRDTLPLPHPPADSLLLPEHSPGGGGTRSLVTGLLTAAAIVALPALVNSGGDASSTRFVVAGVASAAGIVGASHQRRPQPIPENIATNEALRLAWRRQVEFVHADNIARRRDTRVLVIAGAASTLGSP